MVMIRTGSGEPWRAASSSMAAQAYSAFAEILIPSQGSGVRGQGSGKKGQRKQLRLSSPDPCPLTPDPYSLDAASVPHLDDVQAAFLPGRAGPAAGPLVGPLADGRRARPAADARIALIVQRIVRDVVL